MRIRRAGRSSSQNHSVSSHVLPSPPSPARRLQNQPVSRPDLAAVDRGELFHLARGAYEPLTAGEAGFAAFDAVRALHPVLGEEGEGHRLQEDDLADGAVPAAPAARSARAGADGETVQPHGVAVLQHLGVGDPGVGHVGMDGARAVEAGTGAGAAADGLVETEARIAEEQVVHRALAAGERARAP